MNELIRKWDAIYAIEGVDWYHINKNGELVKGANSREDEPLYKAKDVYDALENVKPVQPETATITIGRTKGETTMWYECDACGEPVDWNDCYCRKCGRRLVHGRTDKQTGGPTQNQCPHR